MKCSRSPKKPKLGKLSSKTVKKGINTENGEIWSNPSIGNPVYDG
jgi:hypothetical protein